MKNRIPGEFRAGDDFGQEIGTADFGRAFFLDHPKNLARHSKHGRNDNDCIQYEN
jgi:hypothetical protein